MRGRLLERAIFVLLPEGSLERRPQIPALLHGVSRSLGVLAAAGVTCWLLGLVVSCSPPTSPRRPSPSAPRPPAVVADPRFTPPPATTSAPASDEVLTLEAPAGMTGAVMVVDAFFEAVGKESSAELSQLMTSSAVAQFDNSAGTSALGSWRRRFSAFDYDALAAQPAYQHREVEAFDARAAQRLRSVRDLRLMPAEDEVLVVVRLATSEPRLFGTHVHLVLTPGPDGYRIRATYEDFNLR